MSPLTNRQLTNSVSLSVPTTDKSCQFVSTDKPTVFDLINRVHRRSELTNRQLTNSVSLSVPTTDKSCQFVSTDKPTVFDFINRGLHKGELTNRQLTNSVSLSVPTTDKFGQFVSTDKPTVFDLITVDYSLFWLHRLTNSLANSEVCCEVVNYNFLANQIANFKIKLEN